MKHVLRTLVVTTSAIISVTAVHGQFLVGPGEVLEVGFPTSQSFILDGGTLAPADLDQGGDEVVLAGPIALRSDSAIVRPQNRLVTDFRGNLVELSTGPVTLAGPISGAGDVELGNLSRNELVISGDNIYGGQTFINSGVIVANTPTAFGSPNRGTTIRDGSVRIRTATDERFRIEGGSLLFEPPDIEPTQPLIIAGGAVTLPQLELYNVRVVVDAAVDDPGGVIQFGFDDAASWTGGSTGVGNLQLGGRVNVDAPLTHDGDLIVDGVKLNAVNTYTGRTIITDRYTIDRGDVFGTSTTPIEIDEAEVIVNVLPHGDRGFAIYRGTLDVQTAEPINGNIILGGGFDARIRGNGVFNGPIDYVTTPGGGRAFLGNGVFNGPIRGTTELFLGEVTLNAANEIQGIARVNGGHVVVNHEQAIKLASTQIEEGVVELNVPAIGAPLMTGYRFDASDFGTIRLNVDQDIDRSWVINEGLVESNANVRIKRLVLLGIAGFAGATTTDQGSLEIAEEIRVVAGGSVSGQIKGSGTIRSVGRHLVVDGDLSEFTGDLVVDSGRLSLQTNDLGSGAIRLGHQGELYLFGDFTISNDLFLNGTSLGGLSAPAFRHGRNGSDAELTGEIHIGDSGAALLSGNGVVRLAGTVVGSNLTLLNGGFALTQVQEDLRGDLQIDGATLSFEDEGALKSIDAISLRRGASLYLPASSATDRIEDSIRINSQGSHIQILSNRLTPTTETLDTLHLEQGYTSVVASSDHGSLAVGLALNNIVREEGAIVHFREVGRVTTTRIDNVATFDSEMIGAWAVTRDGFASINDAGFLGILSSSASSLSSATASDHVFLTNSETLSADTTIASLQSERQGQPIDLGEHRLTIVSGGMFRTASISNGQLTAGSGSDAELIVHESHTPISADIVDNPQGGSVALVINSGATRLSGNNSYSGGTWVIGSEYYPDTNATAIIENLAAIPANDRVYVDNAVYQMQPLTSGEVMLDELHIRNGGHVSGSFLAPLNVQRMFLEDGSINAMLVGSGTIVKRTEGSADFSNSHGDDFEGEVTVQGGLLSVDYDGLPKASFVVEGGRLQVGGGRLISNPITLNGGAFEGNTLGEVQILSESILYSDGFTTIHGPMSGRADLTVQGTLDGDYDDYVGIFGDASQFHGDWHVESGALRFGAPGNAGDGEIHVSPGARLILGSNRETSPPTELSNSVYLRSGTLVSTLPTRGGATPPASATGDVIVKEEAFIGAIRLGNVAGQSVPGLSFSGRLMLEDDSQVYGLSDIRNTVAQSEVPLVDVSGQLLVGANTGWNLLTSSLSVTGSISPLDQDGSINFIGVENSLDLSEANITLDASQNLAIFVNDKPVDLALVGQEAGISGDGTFMGNLKFTDGATVSPGDSPGNLTIVGNTTIGSGAAYDWEIAATSGLPGVAWDLLLVDGDLHFAATEDMPWLLRVSDLLGFSPLQGQPLLIASANSISGFDPTAIRFDVSGITGFRPNLASDDLRLFVQDGGLYLLAVPEPASWLCSIIGTLVLVLRRQAR